MDHQWSKLTHAINFYFNKCPLASMSKEPELTSYAHKEASNMGLKKPLDIKVDPRLGFSYYTNTQSLHKVRLVSSSKSDLKHELGHAYMSEKLSKLYRFFDKFARPLNFLSARFGEFGDLASNIIYSLAVGVTFFFGILFVYIDGPLIISLPLILVGLGLILPMIEEFMAYYFGKKYEPIN